MLIGPSLSVPVDHEVEPRGPRKHRHEREYGPSGSIRPEGRSAAVTARTGSGDGPRTERAWVHRDRHKPGSRVLRIGLGSPTLSRRPLRSPVLRPRISRISENRQCKGKKGKEVPSLGSEQFLELGSI